MKNKIFKGFLFSLCLMGQASLAAADPYASAYGPQAIMSPASTSLSYGLPTQSQPQQMPAMQPQQGNGVYLTGSQQAPLQQSMPTMQMPAYGGNAPAQAYYPQTMPLDPMTGYGANSYTAYKPMYGQPPQMVQRNSSNYGEANNFPYRKNPDVVLNPNSMTSYNPEAGKPQSAVMNILNGITQRPMNNNGNWFQRVFQRNNGSNTATADQRSFGW